MKELFKNLFGWLCKRSTKPDITSYKWARREVSVFASCLLWVVWFCRVLSLQQNIKVFYRWLAEKKKFGYTENESGRPDVPPWLGEIYFLLYTIVFFAAYYFQIYNPFLKILAIYYLFESSMWVLYYTVFRRFFELGYTIYHQLEYITAVILIIPTQAICFTHLFAVDFVAALSGLLGNGNDNTPLLITVCSYLLSAIVIGMIISNFPGENVKKCVKKAKMLVIGCGDVVRSRLFPSLNSSDYTVQICAYDLQSASGEMRLPICQYLASPDAIVEKVKEDLSDNSIVWIETPPGSHLYYLGKGLKTKARLLAVEKPITVEPDELKNVDALLAKQRDRNRVFFLSYYILEKALPLSYLAALAGKDLPRSNAYAKYLQIDGQPLVKKWHELLGDLKSVEVNIFEGKDEREWVTGNQMGGHLFETFVHNVLIASLFAGSVNDWKTVAFSDADYAQNVYEICLDATKKVEIKKDEETAKRNIEIHLRMRKNGEDRHRNATISFDNGRIEADFDAKTAEVFFDQLKTSAKLQVAEEYAHNYGVMTDLVGRVYSGEYKAGDIDGYKNQKEVLEQFHKWSKTRSAENCE